jgi:lipoprotein-anchoring transpeptidase ErfK/SrfK
MSRWIGFLGSWALFVLGLGLATVAVAGEWINMRDGRRLNRVEVIDSMMSQQTGTRTEQLQQSADEKSTQQQALREKVAGMKPMTEELPDTGQTILVSTAENRVYVRRNGQVVFTAVCSTGKGTTMAIDGHTKVFDTPIGKFHIKSKDENPLWVPPDWHYVEQARKSGMRVVHLLPGQSIDASTGEPARENHDSGVWSWLDGGNTNASSRVIRLRGNTVVQVENGVEEELPPGKMIVAGGAVIIPPIETPQRHFDKVLGKYRLNLGDGYALHGTQELDQLGQSVSHGCVRLGDADIEALYQMANVGDEVVIY